MLFYIKRTIDWLLTYKDVLYLVKKNKPEGKPNAGWVDNGEWK